MIRPLASSGWMTTESQSYHQSLKPLAIMAGKYTIQARSKSLMCHFIVYVTHVMYEFVLHIVELSTYYLNIDQSSKNR